MCGDSPIGGEEEVGGGSRVVDTLPLSMIGVATAAELVLELELALAPALLLLLAVPMTAFVAALVVVLNATTVEEGTIFGFRVALAVP